MHNDATRICFNHLVRPEDVSREDGGQALIIEMDDDDHADGGPFIRIHGWNESIKHPLWMVNAVGKKFRVTIEQLDVH